MVFSMTNVKEEKINKGNKKNSFYLVSVYFRTAADNIQNIFYYSEKISLDLF